MQNLIAMLILACILFFAIRYIVRAKRRGEKCIGCPYARECASHQGGSCGCGHCTKRSRP